MATVLEDQLSFTLCRILVLEEALAEANDTIRRLVAGDSVEWDA